MLVQVNMSIESMGSLSSPATQRERERERELPVPVREFHS